MKRYNIKLIREDEPMLKKKKGESMLKDLLTVMPTLRKHKLDGEILTKVRTLRSGRRAKAYTLELSRKYPTFSSETGKVVQNITVSAPLPKSVNKVEVLTSLKAQIIDQIKKFRKEAKPYVEQYRFREGVTVPKLAEVYLETGTFTKIIHRRVRVNMTKAKAPKTEDKANYIGIEIEVASKLDREKFCDILFEAGVGKYVHVKRDGSIKVDEEFPHEHEITVLVKQEEYAEVVDKLCTALNTQCHIRVDKSTGLHVHLDMRQRKVEKCFSNLVSMQHFLYAMCPAARKTSQYSVPVEKKDWHITPGHYAGINSDAYQKYRTLELRMHSGTTQASKINGWIAFLLKIVEADTIISCPKSMEEVTALLGLNEKLSNYIESRIAKFESQHNKIKKSSPSWMALVSPVKPLVDSTTHEQSETA